MNELYNNDILRLATQIPLTERLDAPDVTVVKTSRICGSRVTGDYIIKDGRITAYGQEVKACALGQASSSIVGKHIIGNSLEDLEPVADAVRLMLAEGAPSPSGEWAEYAVLAPAKDHKSRHASIMLPLEAAIEAFGQINSPSSN